MKKVITMLILFTSTLVLFAANLPEPVRCMDEISVSVEIYTVGVLTLDVEQFALRKTRPYLIKNSYTKHNQSFYSAKTSKFKSGKILYVEGVPGDEHDSNIAHQTYATTHFLETEGNRVSQLAKS